MSGFFAPDPPDVPVTGSAPPSSLCPSAHFMVKAISNKRPDLAEAVDALAERHLAFLDALKLACPAGREFSVARTKAEECFAWALKAIGDDVLKDASNGH